MSLMRQFKIIEGPLCAQKFCILPQGIEGVVDNVEAIGGGT